MFIYTIYDRKAEYCLPVFSQRSNAEAERQFTQLVVASDTQMSQYPGDFDLVCIAAMDVQSGKVNALEVPRTVTNGLTCLVNSRSERQRYKSALEQPEQMDIEEITGSDAS